MSTGNRLSGLSQGRPQHNSRSAGELRTSSVRRSQRRPGSEHREWPRLTSIKMSISHLTPTVQRW